MTTSLNPTYPSPYQTGGSLPPDAPTYVKRQADQDLYQALLAGTYCYILNARQMGKSSLRIRTMRLLEEQGITCVDIELSGIGSQQITASQWYGGMIQELVSGFELVFKRRSWIQEREDLSPVQRLSQFIETVLLKQITTPMVVFIDEIDSVLGLKFPTDEFFGLIRHCYEKRATHADYQRLTFVLLGVATPSDLMRSKRYSPPFNIGRAIPLQGFHIDDCEPLIQALSPHVSAPKAILKEILYWSGGQPFLTQKLCWLVTHYGNEHLRGELDPDQDVRNYVADLVHTHVIQHWEAGDEPEHLRTIRDRLLREGQSNQEIIETYRTILQTGSIPSRDQPEHVKLRLTGIVEVVKGRLRIKNPIYATIFDAQWLDHEFPPVRVTEPLGRFQKHWWLPDPVAIAIGLGVTSMIVAVSVLGVLEKWELRAFDHWMRSRPDEGADERFLMVTITEADVQAQPIEERGAASLSDKALARLLTVLEQGQPRVIGLDIYRQQPVDRRYADLAQMLSTNDRLFAICYYGEPGVSPPPEVPAYQHGFNSVVQDRDGVLRRQILAVTAPAPCQNAYSLNWWLAQTYLQDEGIEPVTEKDYLQLGSVPFKRIQPNMGGYRHINTDGHQILINYRATEQIAETVTLQDVLSDQFDLNRVTNRIVLIGVVAPTFNDHDWFTPYSGGQNLRRISGVELQAHMTSQMISAVLDGRPLLWSWSESVEILWIGTWTVGASVLVMKMRSQRYLTLMVGTMVLGLSGICWGLMCYGGWIPFIAPVLGIMVAGTGINIYRALMSFHN